MQNAKASIFTEEQELELVHMKAHFPFRICWGAVNNNGEFVTGASKTLRRANDYVRKGWLVGTL